jgi:hypothetical protein
MVVGGRHSGCGQGWEGRLGGVKTGVTQIWFQDFLGQDLGWV